MNDIDDYYYSDIDTRSEIELGVHYVAFGESTSGMNVRDWTDDTLYGTTPSFLRKSTFRQSVPDSFKENVAHSASASTLIGHHAPMFPGSHRITDVITSKSDENFIHSSVDGSSVELQLSSAPLTNYTRNNNYTPVTNNEYNNIAMSPAAETSYSSKIPYVDHQQINETSFPTNLLLADLFRESVQDVSSRGLNLALSFNSNRSADSNTSSSNVIITGNGTNRYGDLFSDEEYDYDYDSHDDVLPLQEILPVSLVYGFTLMVGVVGNLLVIAAVVRDRRLRSITNLFLTSLASADLLLLCFCVPVKCVAFFSFSWTFGLFLCKSVHYFQIVAMVCSVMTLTVMSIERNIAILFPLRSKRICTRSRARIVVVLLWAGSVVLALPILAGQKHKLVGERRKAFWCTKEWDKPLYGILFESYMLVLLFLVPVGVMVVSYTTICMELSRGTKFRRQATSTLSSTTYRGYASHRARHDKGENRESFNGTCRNSMLHSRHQERMDQEKLKVIRMLIVVVVLFAVCWGPILINNLLVAVDVLDKLHLGHLKPLRQTIFLLSYLNSSLNPLVYGFMSRHFRRGFREAICVCCSSNGRRGRDNRTTRRTNNQDYNYASEGGASANRTGNVRLSPVTEQVSVALGDELEESPVGNRRYGRKIWARTDRVALDLQDM